MSPVTSRKRKPPKQGSMPGGVKIQTRDGETVAELYKRAAAVPGYSGDKAKAAGVSDFTFRSIETVVLLAERDDLSESDRKSCAAALELLERHKQAAPAFRLVEDIAKRVWPHKARRAASDPRIELFENALKVIEQVTQGSDHIELPYLTEALTFSAFQTIQLSVAALHRLKRRINQQRREQDE